MSYLEIIQEYEEQSISEQAASTKLETEIVYNYTVGNVREAAKAQVCRTYFVRYQQYNRGQISPEDFLLYLRNLILFIGRIKLPRLIMDMVDKWGDNSGLYVSKDGFVDANIAYPDWLSGHRHFIDEVYSLNDSIVRNNQSSCGDSLLRESTVFSNYKSIEQKVAVHIAAEIPDNYTLMISLPTGGGKSLVTQILAAYEEKMTIVIVPTVSLALDQYNQARNCIKSDYVKKHIFYYESGIDEKEISQILWSVENKKARMLIASPEAIMKNEKLNTAIRKAAECRYLRNVVVDEAHIVPDWGVKFRPEFQIFAVMLKELNLLSDYHIRTFLLSATLSENVVMTLSGLFGEEKRFIQYRCDSLRREPRFIFIPSRSYTERKKRVIELVKILPKPVIVYVIEPAEAEEYRGEFVTDGYRNIYCYTGDTPQKQRVEILKRWKENKIDVILATSAFGVGVDKGNVRTIIHSCVPESLSRFYQEVGRAGRDGLPALSIIMPYIGKDDNNSDLSKSFELVKKSILKAENIVKRWNSIMKSQDLIIEGDTVTANLNTPPLDFPVEKAEHVGLQNMGWNINMLLLLHRQKYIELLGAKYVSTVKSYFFTFKLVKSELLCNSSALFVSLEPDREKEYNDRVEGYRRMADIIHRPNAKCWAKHFVSLFPLARPHCSGCPIHPQGDVGQEDRIRIREPLCLNLISEGPNRKLERLMGNVLKNLLVTIEDYKLVDCDQFIVKINKFDISCVVMPDTKGIQETCHAILLDYEEFDEVADKAPWLLRNGVCFLFSEDADKNNSLFETANSDKLKEYRKIWCCNEDTYIYSRKKRINEFLDCRLVSLEDL